MRSVSIPSEASSNILWCKASGKSKHDLPQTKEWKNSINKLSKMLCKPYLSATKLKEPCCLAGKQHSTQDDHKTFIIGKHTFQNHLQAKTSEYRVTLLTLLSKAHWWVGFSGPVPWTQIFWVVSSSKDQTIRAQKYPPPSEDLHL